MVGEEDIGPARPFQNAMRDAALAFYPPANTKQGRQARLVLVEGQFRRGLSGSGDENAHWSGNGFAVLQAIAD